MLPKIVHQIWLGTDDPPIDWMQTWVDFCMHAGWEYRVWTEHTIKMLRNTRVYDYYYDQGDYAGASDVARVELLHRFGGWFVDADEQLVDPIGFASDPMQMANFVISEHLWHKNRYINGIMGSTVANPILTLYMDMIEQLGKEGYLSPAWATVGGTSLYRATIKSGEPYYLVPMRMFCPIHFGEVVEGDSPVYGIHHQYSTRKVKDLPDYDDIDYRHV